MSSDNEQSALFVDAYNEAKDKQAKFDQVKPRNRNKSTLTATDLKRWWSQVILGEITETRFARDGEPYEICPLSERVKASQLLAKTLGMFEEREAKPDQSNLKHLVSAIREARESLSDE